MTLTGVGALSFFGRRRKKAQYLHDACKQHAGTGRTTGNISIDRNYRIHGTDYGVAGREDSATASTGPNRHHQLRRRYGIIGMFQGGGHVSGYGAGDQQHIRMLRGCYEVNAKSLQVVGGVGKGVGCAKALKNSAVNFDNSGVAIFAYWFISINITCVTAKF